jgi:transposase
MRRKFSKEFKLAAVQRMKRGQAVVEIARAIEVHPSELYHWRRDLDQHGERAFSGIGRKREEESRIAELERKVGQQTLEIDFLKRALQHAEEQRRLRALDGGAASMNRSKRKSNGARS